MADHVAVVGIVNGGTNTSCSVN